MKLNTLVDYIYLSYGSRMRFCVINVFFSKLLLLLFFIYFLFFFKV